MNNDDDCYTPVFEQDGVVYITKNSPYIRENMTFEDEIYFSSRDLFVNLDDLNDYFRISGFIGKLTGNICYEDRSENFKYEILPKEYYKHTLDIYKIIDKSWFNIGKKNYKEDVQSDKFIPLEEFLNNINNLHNKLK